MRRESQTRDYVCEWNVSFLAPTLAGAAPDICFAEEGDIGLRCLPRMQRSRLLSGYHPQADTTLGCITATRQLWTVEVESKAPFIAGVGRRRPMRVARAAAMICRGQDWDDGLHLRDHHTPPASGRSPAATSRMLPKPHRSPRRAQTSRREELELREALCHKPD